tara:strand:- start:429 stop:914 length:486 start_codon:yes stop_codon:yes gene_type:complete
MNKSTQEVIFSSKSNEWSTPKDFFDKLNAIYNFTLDPCATDKNHLCEKYFTAEADGLSQSWGGESVFMNPPYGSGIGDWLEKAWSEVNATNNPAKVVVALIPSRTDTKYFHSYCLRADEIHFVKGRLKFGSSTNSAPFPSCVVVFRPKPPTYPKMSSIGRK